MTTPTPSGPFERLDERELRTLAPNGVIRSFTKGTVILNEGDATDALYVILAGRVKVFVSDEDGKEMVIGTIGSGDYFGEIVLDGGPRSASIMSLEPCRFFVIPRSDVEGLIEHNPAFARDLIRKLIGKVRNLTQRARDLALKDVYGRFVRFVDENAVDDHGKRAVNERLTQQDIAARIGGSREMVSRILKELTAGGYIAVDAKRITVLKGLPPNW